MPEATIVCCDCSEYMRNGDFLQTRFEAQKGALAMITQRKLAENHENRVGLIAMGKEGFVCLSLFSHFIFLFLYLCHSLFQLFLCDTFFNFLTLSQS